VNYEIATKIELVDMFYSLEFYLEITEPERKWEDKK